MQALSILSVMKLPLSGKINHLAPCNDKLSCRAAPDCPALLFKMPELIESGSYAVNSSAMLCAPIS
jgi:hypothetical protein